MRSFAARPNIASMKHLNRIRIAALSAAFFLGGMTAVGFGLKATRDSTATPVTVTHPRVQVIHQTRIRTVHVRPKRKPAPPAPPAPAVAAPPAPTVQQVSTPPAVVQAPKRVKSRVSPTGRRHEGDDGGEREGHDD
jgi:hypothetical protein